MGARNRVRECLLLMMLLCALAGPAAAQAISYPLRLHSAVIEVDQAKEEVAKWQREERIALAFVVSVALLGVVTTGLQLIKRPWTAIATGVAGALVSGATALNAVMLPADYKTLDKRVTDGGGYVKKMDYWVRYPANTDSDREYVLEQVLKEVASFHGLHSGEQDTPTKTAAWLPSVGVVLHAEAQKPAECGCSALQANLGGDDGYSCGTATASSLTAAHDQAVTNAVVAFARRLDSATKGAEPSEGAIDYVRKIASEADSCAAPGKGSSSVTVLLRMPSHLAGQNAQTAFVSSVQAAPARVPNAVGESALAGTAAQNIQIPVRATPARYGDFVFSYSIRPGSPRLMQLQTIRVIQDGTARATRWSFTVLLDGKVVATLPDQNYSDSPPATYRIASAIALPPGRASQVKILGYRH